jgi:flagellar motor switch protein FliN/FliY
MSDSRRRIHGLEVPVIVLLAEKTMTVSQVMRLAPGTIIELPKSAEERLDLLVNNKVIGRGDAVKVGENFGLEITEMGAEAGPQEESEPEPEILGNEDIEALTSALFSG